MIVFAKKRDLNSCEELNHILRARACSHSYYQSHPCPRTYSRQEQTGEKEGRWFRAGKRWDEVSSESIVMYCKANFYAWCQEPLYFPVFGINISKNLLLRNQVPLSVIHGTIHWLFDFRWKMIPLSYYNEGQESRKPGGGGGTLDSSDADDRMRASNKTPPQKPWINRKTIPGRISEPYMSKFPESIKRYKKKNKNIGNWISSCFFLHSTIWSYRGHLQIVQNTPKILRKSSQILTQKIPQSKVSNTKKSFDQPRQLKTGVPRPLGPQAPRSSRHAWKIRPTVVSQGIQRESTGNL